MNSHDEIRKLLSAFSGNDLPEQERDMVAEHLKMCDECRSELADLQVTLRALRSTPEVEPPPWLTTRIMAHVRQQQEQKPGWLKRLFFPLHIKLPLEVCAVLCICVTGYYLSRQVGQELRQAPHESPAVSVELPASPPVSAPEQKEHATTPAPIPVPSPATKKVPVASSTKVAVQPPPPAAQPQSAQDVTPAAPPPFTPVQPEKVQEAAVKALPESVRTHELPQYGLPLERADEARKSAAHEKMSMEIARHAARIAAKPLTPHVRNPVPSAVIALPEQLTIRLNVTMPGESRQIIQEALVRTGGTIINEPPAITDRIRARIPADSLAELYKQLEKTGKIIERPPTENRTGTVDVTILW